MKRRKTVSVTPAMGARTVAGAIPTPPMDKDDGTVRVARPLLSASPAGTPEPAELSQNFFTPVFYFLAASPPMCNGAPELLMRTIRKILLTEYIGAIVIAVLIADACSALFSTVVAQVGYHLHHPPGDPRVLRGLSSTYSVLETLTRIALYLLSAYLLARWLYPAKTEVSEHGSEPQQDRKSEEGM
jgi:hypothetical protein